MISAAGCIKHDSIVVTAQQGPPPFTVGNDSCMTNPTTIPLEVEFNCLSNVSCALSNACAGGTSQSYTAGTGSAIPMSSYEWPTPYGNYYKNSRHQFLVLASELLAMGVQPGNINSIAFNVTATNSIQALPNFTIKMMCTSLTSLPAAINSDNFIPGTIQVHNTPMLNVVVGANVHTFTQPYAWDGTSNLIIETCYDLTQAQYTYNASVTASNTSFISSINAYSDSDPVCVSPIVVVNYVSFNDYNVRPDMAFNVTSSVNSANYTYSWVETTNGNSTAGIANPSSPQTSVTLTPGNHTYAVTVTTLNGLCSRTDSVTYVIGGVGADIMASDSVFCSTDAVSLFLATPIGGAWSHHAAGGTSNGGGVVPGVPSPPVSSASFHPELSVLGSSYVIYTFGPANCAIQDSVLVQVFQKIPANFTTIGPFCEYDSPVTLSSIANNGGGTWTIDGVTATQFNPAVLGPSTAPGYALKYKTDLGVGCPDSVQKLVEVFPAPSVDFNADTTAGCLPSVPVVFNSVVSYNGTPSPGAPGSYFWSFGDAGTSTIDDPVHVYSVAGDLTVSLTYTDSRGCMADTMKIHYIDINPIPEPYFIYEPSNPTALEPHVDFFNTTPNSSNLIWKWNVAALDSSTTFNISYDFPNFGEYMITLTATSPEGCEADVTRPVTIDPDYAIYVPTSFTPNGDGKNDIFTAKMDGVQKDDYTFSVYDRWGQKVFQTNDINVGWKGSKNNSDNIVNESGTYIWKIIYKDAFMKGHTITGHVTVIR
jgi:gliding motility-associated-like protein